MTGMVKNVSGVDFKFYFICDKMSYCFDILLILTLLFYELMSSQNIAYNKENVCS